MVSPMEAEVAPARLETVGATLVTVAVPVYSVAPPSLSLIFAFTLRVPLSVVAHVVVFEVPKSP